MVVSQQQSAIYETGSKLVINLPLARYPPRVLHWRAPNVERRIMKVAIIRWDFPQGHADEQSVQCWDKIPGL